MADIVPQFRLRMRLNREVEVKRIVLIITIIFLVLAPAYSAYEIQRTKEFTLMAGYETVLYLEIDEIPAQSNQYIAGMPFNIEDFQVQAGTTEHGREIATWNMLSNTPEFGLKIWGEPMYHVDDTEKKNPLNYVLNIQYMLGYYLENGSLGNSESKWLEFDSTDGIATEGDAELIDLLGGVSTSAGTFIGSLGGSIFFEFTPATSQEIMNDMDVDEKFPEGEYTATVTFKLEVTQ